MLTSPGAASDRLVSRGGRHNGPMRAESLVFRSRGNLAKAYEILSRKRSWKDSQMSTYERPSRVSTDSKEWVLKTPVRETLDPKNRFYAVQ